MAAHTKKPEERNPYYNPEWYKRPDVIAKKKAYRDSPERKAVLKVNNEIRLAKLWKQVFDLYGWKCACCEEGNIDFLTIDHINGGGKHERKNREYSMGAGVLTMAVKEADPSKYQILCFNCNMGRQFRGGEKHECPHCMGEGTLKMKMRRLADNARVGSG